MVQATDKHPGVLQSIDWWTIAIYMALLIFGWISVCGASYSFEEPNLFSLSARSGMQIVWIGTSLFLGLVLLLLDDRFYDTFAFVIYGVLLLLLFGTIFNPHSIKGSHSWLVLGPLRLQPAEFAKFATALALAKFMGRFRYNIHNTKDFLLTLAIIFVPMFFIIMQRETGSALVYLSFFLMLYREGMTGSVLFTGAAMVIYFVIGIRYAEPLLLNTPTSIGRFVVLLLIQIFSSALIGIYCRNLKQAIHCLELCLGITVLCLLFSVYVIPFDLYWVQMVLSLILVGYLLWQSLLTRFQNYLWIALFAMGSILFFSSADYALNNILEPHQRTRINVLLGLEEDLKGAGYNVHQSEIAIGSGGLRGKGFLNGTQTKLKYVPEQDTDFIFCTVGEEEGFVGAASVLLLFLALILRLIQLAERQSTAYGRVYGYCVVSIFLFHVFINVGMVLGLTPVIGIPLPFFSYGGSSLWGFTFLLFIFLRIDAGRNMAHR
ncbi:rod shape-determining protein RodA [Prevotella sp. E13-17]|uniref:rod shape-determining protein RodA n=1 Tax=Prevotella sp. E13-17 TaxID=2913616 RepID=UPI001EDA4485|nr:rod shape-determining protein RodA [Prevotella sp. E13-17]UKK50647.1 rod shape-determining protein RodA [Prevotella sp. E13-17]